MEKEEEEKEEETGIAVLETSEQALQVARQVIDQFDKLFADSDKRKKVTTGTGLAAGYVANIFADAMHEEDEDKKAEMLEVGAVSILEMTSGLVAAMLAGSRRRVEKKKQEKKVQ